jgi:flagellar biosynthesis/type III secretory pathway protein FliH
LGRVRAEAYAEGLREAGEAARGEAGHATARALAAIATQLADATQVVAARAEANAEAVARLVMDTLAVTLPTLAARHGAAEIAAFIAALHAPLAEVTAFTIHVHPSLTVPVAEHLAALGTGVAAQVLPDAALPIGDARAEWAEGRAIRAASRARDAVADTLRPLGLLDDPPAPITVPATTDPE